MTANANTWIRFSRGATGPRFDAAELLVTDEKIADLAELTAASIVRISGELLYFPQRADIDGVETHYVRALPSTALGRQHRDQLIGAGLIRRFALEPHIVVHLADGVALWTAGDPASQTAASWAALNDLCPVVCALRGVVGTHAANDLDEVTCKACRAHAEVLGVVAKKLSDGCGVESRLVKGIWEHSFIEPKEVSR